MLLYTLRQNGKKLRETREEKEELGNVPHTFDSSIVFSVGFSKTDSVGWPLQPESFYFYFRSFRSLFRSSWQERSGVARLSREHGATTFNEGNAL